MGREGSLVLIHHTAEVMPVSIDRGGAGGIGRRSRRQGSRTRPDSRMRGVAVLRGNPHQVTAAADSGRHANTSHTVMPTSRVIARTLPRHGRGLGVGAADG